MQRVLLLGLLLAFGIGLDCLANQNYVKLTKISKGYASEESIKIYSGSSAIYTTPTLTDNSERVLEICLDASTNSQYDVNYLDSYGDSWSVGSYATMIGKYSEVIFRKMMSEKSTETIPLSLYYPVTKGSTAKFTATFNSDWYKTSCDTASWSDKILGSNSTSTGNQFFRLPFTGVAGLAAYEVSVYFKDGIVLFLNGNEIGRDNMDPSVSITASTVALGSYVESSWRSFVRNGIEVTSGSNMLTIGIFFVQPTSSHDVDMNAWVHQHAQSSAKGNANNCYAVAPIPSLTANQGTGVSNIYDCSTSSCYTMSPFEVANPSAITYAYFGHYQINGFEIWPYSSTGTAPKDFSYSVSLSTSYSLVGNAFDLSYLSSKYTYSIFPVSTKSYPNHRVTVTRSAGSSLNIYEMRALVCNVAVPTSIEYAQSTYSYSVGLENIDIRPKVTSLVQCSITPSLPSGVSLNANSCAVSGVANVVSSQTYTITSALTGISGQFTLVTSMCTGAGVEVLRTYGTSMYETFSIQSSTGTVMYNEAASTVQVASTTVSRKYCWPQDVYTLTMGTTAKYWYNGSFLTIRALFIGDEYEPVLYIKYNENLAIPSVHKFSTIRWISPSASWKYNIGYSSNDWYSVDTSSWSSGSKDNFPALTNQFSIFRSSFTVSSAQLADTGAFSLSLRYQYGCVVYVNSREVYRNNIAAGDIAGKTANAYYSDLAYRQIILPVHTVKIGEVAAVDYIVSGSNTIAIAIIANTATPTGNATFDASIRTLGVDNARRVMEFTVTSTGILGIASDVFNMQHLNSINAATCGANHITITFNNDRREWVNAVELMSYYDELRTAPIAFQFQGKQAADSAWTTLSTQSGWKWWSKAQTKTLYLLNNVAYNMYRISEIASVPVGTDCDTWYISLISLFSRRTAATYPELAYPQTNTGYKNIEMAEIYPTGADYKSGFSVSPALPTGLSMDPPTGVIMGTPTVEVAATTYSVTCNSISGESIVKTFSLTITICTGGRSLVNIRYFADDYPNEAQYRIYAGTQATGTPISFRDTFPTGVTEYWVDRCLEYGTYTHLAIDTYGDGWYWPSGYSIGINDGFHWTFVDHVPWTGTGRTERLYTFSNQEPFQMYYTPDWKIQREASYEGTDWAAISFDDSTWATGKASTIGTSSLTTVYLRKHFTLTGITQYSVLNVAITHNYGFACYLNKKRVARFLLPASFTSTTPADGTHEVGTASKFHIVLQTNGFVEGNNVIAFELHRPAAVSTSEAFIFDGAAMFSVSECSMLSNTVISLGASGSSSGVAHLFDFDPTTTYNIGDQTEHYIEFTIANLEKFQANKFFFTVESDIYGLTASVMGMDVGAGGVDYVDFLAISDDVIQQETQSYYSSLFMAGFRKFKFQLDYEIDPSLITSEVGFMYCKASGTVCVGVDDFPTVGVNEQSPALCGYGQSGFMTRTCQSSGQWSEVDASQCLYIAPTELAYTKQVFTFIRDTVSTTGAVTYKNVITSFYMDSGVLLPAGMSLNTATGEISGKPTELFPSANIKVFGKNRDQQGEVSISLSVILGNCSPTGQFKATEVGSTATYDCANDGSFVGSISKTCKLGEKNGEWEATKGACFPIYLIVLIVVAALVVIIIVILIVVRTSRKKSNKSKGTVKKQGAAAGTKRVAKV